MGHFLAEIGVSSTAGTLGLLTCRLKQPVILAYFLAGAIIGPACGLQLITGSDNIQPISEIGLMLLSFKFQRSYLLFRPPF